MAGKPDRRRLRAERGGPMLVEGPVEVRTEDGAVHRSDRFTVALCTCARSRLFPWCDASHRRRRRPDQDPAAEPDNGPLLRKDAPESREST